MSLTIDLPDGEALALKAKAKAHGLSAEEYALQVLEHDLAPDWLRQSWSAAKRSGVDQLSAEEIEAEITAARKARRASPPQPGA